jgi:hypothetical protein
MKRTVALLLTMAFLTLSMAACAQKKPLHTVTDGERTVTLCGNRNRRTIRVYENGEEIWNADFPVSATAPDKAPCGLEITDLNFDGLNDIKVTVSEKDHIRTEICYLQNTANGLYEKNQPLSELTTVHALADTKLVLSYQKSTDVANGTTVETVTSYRWQGDGLIPYRRLTLTYYPAQDCYCYGVADYLTESFQFDEPDEKWLSPEQFKEADWSFFYYFR